MSFSTQLTLPTTLNDLLAARDEALKRFDDARRILAKAREDLGQHGLNLFPYGANIREDETAIRRELDRLMWTRAFDLTGFSQMMDAKAVKEFEKSLKGPVPEFTEATIRSTFLELFQGAGEMFRRGIFNVFRHLSDDYRTNEKEPFRIGRKIITIMVCPAARTGLEIRSGDDLARLNDIDRVIKTLDGKTFIARELEAQMNAAFKQGLVFENEYYRAKAFRNGNLHLEFKRQDLLDLLNEQIAQYYGENILPDARCA